MIKYIFATAVMGLAVSTTANAGPFYFDVGQDFNGDGNTTTTDYNALGSTNTLATSIYQGTSIETGTQVIDTNRDALLDSSGATDAGFSGPARNQMNVGELNPNQGIDASENFSGGPTDWDSGNYWGMTFEYDIYGEVVDSNSISFDSGTFDFFYENAGDRIQVLSVDITGSDLTDANLDLFGDVNFNFDMTGNEAFVQNFWRDSESGDSYYDIWASGEDLDFSPISFILDTNVNPPVPSEEDLEEGTDANGNPVLVRQSDLNTSMRFEIPEPSALMLLGLGLVGLGVVAHRRRRSDSDLAA